MFILRRITELEGAEMNFCLGKSYTLIKKSSQPREFEKLRKLQNYEDEKIFAFVSSENGINIHPVYSNQINFIMTESGKTFARI